MKIIQISDLHIENSFEFNNCKEMIDQMIDIIDQDLSNEKCIYILCCGDIVNQGNATEYLGKAKIFFDYIKNNIKNKEVKFVFVPGNHDLCNNTFVEFQNFIEQYNCGIDFVNNNVALYKGTEIDFILINTCFHKDYQYGKIDIEQLKKVVSISQKPSLVVMHHTLFSRYSNDRSAISDAYSFLEVLENSKVIGVLHGHTHGYSNILVGDQCRVLGVGSLFTYIQNCNNQFNVIDIRLEKVERIINCRYNFDFQSFTKSILFEDLKRNYFEGDKISELYNQTRDTVKSCGGINNLHISASTSCKEYERDMKKNFAEDIETAKLWLEEEVPSSLYYNHGSYMVDSRIKGIDYIIDELKRNSTSNRAIIPLIHFSDVLDKQFGHLPGLNSIQFGFLNDEKAELFCSVYLRSLEVNHFLRINLSEIYLLIMQILKEIRSVKRLVINVYAFKAQYKEKFSCFKKATIDMLNVGILSKIVYTQDLSKIISLLSDKFGVEETVVNTKGLTLFYDIMKASELYSDNAVKGLNEIIREMDNLRQEYMKSSNYEDIKPIEEIIHMKQEKYINQLKLKGI